MNTKAQLWAAWTVIPFFIIYIIGYAFIAGLAPPHAPTMPAPQLAAWYVQNASSIEFGNSVAVFANTLMFIWPIPISIQMARIERGPFPILAFSQYVNAALLALSTVICHLFFMYASFRPDASPEMVRLLNDAGSLGYDIIYPQYLVQLGAIAMVGFMDKRAKPFLPHWACYATLVTAALGAGGGLSNCFKTGPLAWNGVVSYWMPVLSFMIWALLVIQPCLIRAIKRQDLEEASVSIHTKGAALGFSPAGNA